MESCAISSRVSACISSVERYILENFVKSYIYVKRSPFTVTSHQSPVTSRQ
ncbi:hypothetical protein CKA32_006732 [Geitlerinema sp. FC II]|nr:hypothetical protein CKA32_006732 [Geitlerinema sp. FC II]